MALNITIGIYMIENLINHHKYIGQSKNIERRWKEHKNLSKKNSNTHLYNALKKYGLDNFKFSIIEECTIDNLNEKEIYWIKFFNTFYDGYNESSGGNQNVIFSKLHKRNLSIARQKNKDNISNITTNLWKSETYRNRVISNREQAQHNKKPVVIYNYENEPLVFPSIWQCTKWLIKNNFGHDFELTRSNVRKHIKRNSKSFMGTDMQIRYYKTPRDYHQDILNQ